MKNAMKRIMSLALVVMLLISVVPAAFAADVTYEVGIKGLVGDKAEWCFPDFGYGEVTAAEDATVVTLIEARGFPMGNYDFVRVYNSTLGEDMADGLSAVVEAGQKIVVVVEEKETKPEGDEGDEGDEGETVETVEPIHVEIKVMENGKKVVIKEFDKVPQNHKDAKVNNLLDYGWESAWDDVHTFDYAWSNAKQAYLAETADVKAGDTLSIMLKSVEKEETQPEDEDKDDDMNVVDEGDRYVEGNELHYGWTENNNKDPYPVILRVYLKNSGNGITYSDYYTITTMASSDSELTITEVRNYLKSYYKTTSSTDGFEVDGIYEYVENFNSAWANDADKYSKIYDLDKAKYNDRVTLAVVLDNAKLKGSNADPSNPKTGDDIMIAATTMTLAGAALVAAYELKKRKMI